MSPYVVALLLCSATSSYGVGVAAQMGGQFESSNAVIDQFVVPPPVTTDALEKASLTQMAKYIKKSVTTAIVDSTSNITVFAPVDAAFADVGIWIDGLDGLLSPYLKTLMQYHVVSGVYHVADLRDGQQLATLTGDILSVNITGGTISIGRKGAFFKLNSSDILTKNGVLHEVAGVLTPGVCAECSMYHNMVLDPKFSVVTQLLANASSLTDARAALDATTGNSTFFAPTNAAFAGSYHPTDRYELYLVNARFQYSTVKERYTSFNQPIQFLNSTLVDPAYVHLDHWQDTTPQVIKIENTTQDGVLVYGMAKGGFVQLNEPLWENANGILYPVDGFLLPPLNVSSSLGEHAETAEMSALISRPPEGADFPYGQGFYLDCESGITVFAPNNAAVNLVKDWANGLARTVFTKAVYYHMVYGVFRSTDLYDGQVLRTYLGSSVWDVEGTLLTVRVVGGNTWLLGSGPPVLITATDITTQNGVMHVVDKWLVNPGLPFESVLRNLALQPQLSTFVKHLDSPGFEELKDILTHSLTSTLLAPSDAAFKAGVHNTYNLTMAEILTYHIINDTTLILSDDAETPSATRTWPLYKQTFFVLPEVVQLEEDRGQEVVVTREPKVTQGMNYSVQNYTYTFHSGVATDENYTARVVASDLITSHGAIHILDTFLSLPLSASQTLNVANLQKMAALSLLPSDYSLDDATSVTIFASIDSVLDGTNLQSLIQRQVFQGVLHMNDLRSLGAAGGHLDMIGGEQMKITEGANGTVRIGGATIQRSDILTNNGMVHVVDGLLVADSGLPVWAIGLLVLGSVGAMGAMAGCGWWYYRNKYKKYDNKEMNSRLLDNN